MPQRRVVALCDAGGRHGMGHLMRCLAVAEEAAGRGWEVTFAGDLAPNAVALVEQLVPAARVAREAPAADVLHVDTYAPVTVAPGAATLVSNMQDGAFGVRPADLAVDANLGAEDRFASDAAPHALVGVVAVPIRRQVRRQRDLPPPAGPARRVLVVLGGTDPFGVTTSVVAGLDALRTPVEVTVVTPPDQRAALEGIAARSAHRLDLVPFLADLPAAARGHHLVVSAAGTSVWDFACMGVPMALVCVTDNQAEGYAAAVDRGLAVGLGQPPHESLADRMAALDDLLGDPARLAALRDRGRALVDGLGAWRIVSAWEQLLDVPPVGPVVGPVAGESPLTARPAGRDDARMLLDWRNDPVTRAGSRSAGEVAWDDHVAWLDRVLASDARRLLVVEAEGRAVGTVRWDHLGGRDWEVSITVAPDARGRGLALDVLRAGEAALDVDGAARLVASVHRDNAASRRLFAQAGYLPLTPPDADGFATSARWRALRARPT